MLGFDLKVGCDWQVCVLVNVGCSFIEIVGDRVNVVVVLFVLVGMIMVIVFNFYNLVVINLVVLMGIFNYCDYGCVIQELVEGWLVVDGMFVMLLGGDVCFVVGGEYYYEDLLVWMILGWIGINDGFVCGVFDWIVVLVFGEVFVLIFGMGNGFVGMCVFDLLVLVCYDYYDDVGGIINLKIGFNYCLVDSLKICGNWGILFYVFSLLDFGSLVDLRFQVLGVSLFCVGNVVVFDLFC